MKYMSYIFEDQDVRNQVAASEQLVDIAAKNVINHNLLAESYIYENLESFVTEDLNVTYQNIRNFIINENVTIFSQMSEILSDSVLTEDEKFQVLSGS